MFNNIHNTFNLLLSCIGHTIMVMDNSDNKRGNPLLPLHGLLFMISSKLSFICTISQDNTYQGLCYAAVKHWLE